MWCVHTYVSVCTLSVGYSLGMVKIEAFDISILCTRLLEFVSLITLIASFFQGMHL